MDLHINLWGVLLAGISSLIIGAIYYGPLFGKMWVKLSKIDQARYKRETGMLTPIFLVCALVAAYFVAYFAFLFHSFFQDSWMVASVSVAFYAWLGFAATTVIVHGSVEQRPRQLMYLAIGNRFLSLMAMGLLIGWLHP